MRSRAELIRSAAGNPPIVTRSKASLRTTGAAGILRRSVVDPNSASTNVERVAPISAWVSGQSSTMRARPASDSLIVGMIAAEELRAEFPPLKTLDETPGNLRAQATSLWAADRGDVDTGAAVAIPATLLGFYAQQYEPRDGVPC